MGVPYRRHCNRPRGICHATLIWMLRRSSTIPRVRTVRPLCPKHLTGGSISRSVTLRSAGICLLSSHYQLKLICRTVAKTKKTKKKIKIHRKHHQKIKKKKKIKTESKSNQLPTAPPPPVPQTIHSQSSKTCCLGRATTHITLTTHTQTHTNTV